MNDQIKHLKAENAMLRAGAVSAAMEELRLDYVDLSARHNELWRAANALVCAVDSNGDVIGRLNNLRNVLREEEQS